MKRFSNFFILIFLISGCVFTSDCCKIPPPIPPAGLSFVSVTVGQYANSNFDFIPSLYVSTDGGNTWAYKVDDTQNLPLNMIGGSSGFNIFNGVSCSGKVCVAAGSYDVTGGLLPMLIVSIDGGNTWTYKVEDTNNLPPNAIPGVMTPGVVTRGFWVVKCSGSTCIAGGNYETAAGLFPLVILSTDGGNTWSYKVDDTNNVPPNAAADPQGFISGVSCSENFCAAGGQYTNNSGDVIPMIIFSTDGGSTWTYKVDDLPENFVDNGIFDSVACKKGSICVAGGHYDNMTGVVPMLFVSTDGGTTWTYKVEDTNNLPPNINIIPSVPADPIKATFIYTNCNETVCAASGWYNNPTGRYPAIITSTDGGNTWTYKIDDTQNLPPNPHPTDPDAGFNVINCDGVSLCVASGQYLDTSSGHYPMVVVSTDSGNTWTYKIDALTNVPPNALSPDPEGDMFGAQCHKNICTAGGQYRSAKGYYSMLVVSQDSGNTWTYKVDDTNGLPPNIDEETFPFSYFYGVTNSSY